MNKINRTKKMYSFKCLRAQININSKLLNTILRNQLQSKNTINNSIFIKIR